jgi:hypothetical protein
MNTSAVVHSFNRRSHYLLTASEYAAFKAAGRASLETDTKALLAMLAVKPSWACDKCANCDGWTVEIKAANSDESDQVYCPNCAQFDYAPRSKWAIWKCRVCEIEQSAKLFPEIAPGVRGKVCAECKAKSDEEESDW